MGSRPIRPTQAQIFRWEAMMQGLLAGREGFHKLLLAIQNQNIGELACLGLSAPVIAYVLYETRGLVLGRARDYPRVVRLRGNANREFRMMNAYFAKKWQGTARWKKASQRNGHKISRRKRSRPTRAQTRGVRIRKVERRRRRA